MVWLNGFSFLNEYHLIIWWSEKSAAKLFRENWNHVELPYFVWSEDRHSLVYFYIHPHAISRRRTCSCCLAEQFPSRLRRLRACRCAIVMVLNWSVTLPLIRRPKLLMPSATIRCRPRPHATRTRFPHPVVYPRVCFHPTLIQAVLTICTPIPKAHCKRVIGLIVVRGLFRKLEIRVSVVQFVVVA